MPHPDGKLGEEPSDADLAQIATIAERTATKYGANRFEAEEVAQLVAIKLTEKWSSDQLVEARSRGGQGWRNYISASARNLHRDLLRAHERRVARERKAVGIADGTLPDRPHVNRAQPRDEPDIEACLARLAVLEMIGNLRSNRQRQCMALIFIEGLSPAQTAERLGIHSQTVRFHLRDAMKEIRTDLDRAGYRPDL